jgi:hypothetical protein
MLKTATTIMRRRAVQRAMCFSVLLVAGCAAITLRNALPEVTAAHVELILG